MCVLSPVALDDERIVESPDPILLRNLTTELSVN